MGAGKTTNRIEYLDGVKAFAIFTVIWGHLIQYINKDSDILSNLVFKLIYSFHMPLFYFISGMFFKNALTLNVYNFFTKKFVQLLLPGVIWGIIFFIFKDFNATFTNLKSGYFIAFFTLLKNEFRFPFWFLKELFISYSILYILFKLVKLQLTTFVIALIAVGFIPLFSDNQRFLLPFFILGIYVKDLLALPSKKDYAILYASLIVFLLSLWFWKTNYTIYFTAMPVYYRMSVNQILIAIYRYTIGVSGSVLVIYFTKIYWKYLQYQVIVKDIGKNTLGIYIIQTVFFNIYILNHYSLGLAHISIVTLFLSLAVLILCHISVQMIGKIPFFNKLLLGKT